MIKCFARGPEVEVYTFEEVSQMEDSMIVKDGDVFKVNTWLGIDTLTADDLLIIHRTGRLSTMPAAKLAEKYAVQQ